MDAKGRLVGVAVATIKDGQGIGFVIPTTYLAQAMAGRVGVVRVNATKADASTTARIEVDLVDPANRIRGAVARFVFIPPAGKRPAGTSLEKEAGSKVVELKRTGHTAVAEVPVTSADGQLLVEVTADTGEKQTVTTPVRAFPLSPKRDDYTGTPPTGWKEYSPRDKSFTASGAQRSRSGRRTKNEQSSLQRPSGSG